MSITKENTFRINSVPCQRGIQNPAGFQFCGAAVGLQLCPRVTCQVSGWWVSMSQLGLMCLTSPQEPHIHKGRENQGVFSCMDVHPGHSKREPAAWRGILPRVQLLVG